MSIIKGPTGPRLPAAPAASSSRQTSGASFLSRVQSGVSGAVPLSTPGSAPAVSGRSVVAQAVASAKDAAQASTPEGAQPAGLSPEQQAVMEMSRSFLMTSMQTMFGDFAKSAKVPDAEEP